MAKIDIKCSDCGKRIRLETEENEKLRYCPFCAAAIRNEAEDKAQAEKDAAAAAGHREPQERIMRNVTFFTKDRQPCCMGRIPSDYSPFGRLESYIENSDSPIVVWAAAKNNNGREMFCRIQKNFYYEKNGMGCSEPFLPFDEYLDSNAVNLLETDNIRLVKSFSLPKKDVQEMREILSRESQQLKARSQGDLFQIVIQGIYGGGGAKLYCAEKNGKKTYLVLNAVIIGYEFGNYSPMSRQLIERKMMSNQRVQMMGFNVNVPLTPAEMNALLPIDTNPEIPFSQHRLDGLDNACVNWRIHSFAGFLSPEMPGNQDVQEFFEFINSLRVHKQIVEKVSQFQQQYLSKQIETQNTIYNISKQMLHDSQQSWERQKQTMQSLNDHRNKISAELQQSANEDFDNRSRREHESIMGVNTFEKKDGTRVEYSTSYDRVFQSDKDPDVTVGVNGFMDVPPDWTELDKLK